MNIEQARFNMIEQQIRPWNVLDTDILDLLMVVKRENFVPTAYKNLAFVDAEIPLPGGETMLAPKVEARMLQAVAAKKPAASVKPVAKKAVARKTAPAAA